MSSRFTSSFLLVFWACSSLFAQGVRVDFRPVLGGEPLRIADGSSADMAHEGAAAGAVEVEVLRFYLSDLALLREGEVVFTDSVRHHLLDAERPATLQLPLHPPAGLIYDELKFTLGVDSLTAAAGVFGGDLDPTNGMYWTWRSGYINFKLEGTAPECPARKHRFQFHVGGFQGAFNSEREVRLGVFPGDAIPVVIDLDRFFSEVDLGVEYQIMSPNDKSMRVADLLTGLFRAPES